MRGLTNYSTERSWSAIFLMRYVWVDDSAPIPVCTYKRSWHCATLAGLEYYSVMPTRKAKLSGQRLHLTTALTQVIDLWLLVLAAVRSRARSVCCPWCIMYSNWAQALCRAELSDSLPAFWRTQYRLPFNSGYNQTTTSTYRNL
jgi:hypothetical protein